MTEPETAGAVNACTNTTPVKPTEAPAAALSPSSNTISPSSSTSAAHNEPDMDTPVAVDPSPQSFPQGLHKVYYLEGIKEHLGTPEQHKAQHKASQPLTPLQSDDSFDSLLSTLDDEDLRSLEDDESFYFTPLEEPTEHRMDRVKRELQLRSELLDYLARGQPPAYVKQLAQQEAAVQQMTLKAAQIKETDRLRRRAERRRKRRENSPDSAGTDTEPSNAPVAPVSLFEPQTPTQQNKLPKLSYWSFEWHHGMPALGSLLLACVAHAALYELVLALVLVGMQPFLSYRHLTDGDDRILEADHNSNKVEDICYGVVLLVGLLMARCSGLLFTFDETKKCSLQDPNRVDSQWSQWLQTSKKGRRVKGVLDVFSFYLCFVAVMYFLGRFALCVDQRSYILNHMPSSVSNDSSRTLLQISTQPNDISHDVILELDQESATGALPVLEPGSGICPIEVEDILTGTEGTEDDNSDSSDDESDDSSDDDSSSDSSDDDNGTTGKSTIEWNLPACNHDEDEDVDDHGNDIVWEGGQEDEAYLYENLSASAYHQFWGYGYRAALFDLPHQLFFNLACSVVAIYLLKTYFGCSFWDDW